MRSVQRSRWRWLWLAGLPLLSLGCSPPVTPVPPTSSEFMWQSRQSKFRLPDETVCHGNATLTVGKSAICVAGREGALRCAGRIGSESFGPNFVEVGLTGVDQVLFEQPPQDGRIANACVRTTSGRVYCRGLAYAGTGAWFTWGDPAIDYRAIGSTGRRLCAIDAAGAIHCSEFGGGNTTTTDPGHRSFAVALTGDLMVDPADVFRVQNGLTYCWVRSTGLHCYYSESGFETPLGTPGQVVDGTLYSGPEPDMPDSLGRKIGCALLANGQVSCRRGSTTLVRFINALALGGDYYSTTLCAILADGSLICRGDNTDGKLGTGDTLPRPDSTRVLPAGSISVGCPPG